MDFEPLIDKKKERLAELEGIMSAEDFYSDPKQAAEISREYNYIKKLLEDWDLFSNSRRQLKDNHELVKGDDEEMAALAQEEIPDLESSCEKLELQIQYSLLPQDKTEDRDAIVEIRAGTGGDEASLFAGDLYRMYQRFSELNGWKLEPLESSPSEVGGFKEITVKVSGEEVFRRLKYESGVHRVQRVPETETQGRIHTSTATVAVLPEAEEVDIAIDAKDLRIDTFCSSGPGGQSVNTTYSAVRITRIPTGLVVSQQDEKSQIKNKAKAMKVLRSRLYEIELQRQHDEIAQDRKTQVGTGERSENCHLYTSPSPRD